MLKLAELEDKVLGCWLGKAIGGTLGMPYEGCQEELSSSFSNLQGCILPNDDLDLQLLWLCVLERQGLGIRAADLAKAAADHYICYPDEYGVARWNTWQGFLPPVTGKHNNAFGDGMGAAIRSEIWACLAPGQPFFAAAMAREDALVDHYGDGVYAEMFLAAMESALFVNSDIHSAMAAGRASIPETCRIAQAAYHIYQWHREGHSWSETRSLVLKKFHSHNFTDVTVNLCFILMGILYGCGDFERSITLAVNGGFDTDCTGATCGSIMGIHLGASGIPLQFRQLADNKLTFHNSLQNLPIPQTLEELTSRTLQLHERWSDQKIYPLPNATPEEAPMPKVRNDWLVFRFSSEDVMHGEPLMIAEAETSPLAFESYHNRFDGIHLNLSSTVERTGDVLYLITWLESETSKNSRAFLMCCAQAGITAWWDGVLVLNYHGRKPPIPAFHRTEGGATVPVSLEAGRAHCLKIRLLCNSGPLVCTVAMGDELGRYLSLQPRLMSGKTV